MCKWTWGNRWTETWHKPLEVVRRFAENDVGWHTAYILTTLWLQWATFFHVCPLLWLPWFSLSTRTLRHWCFLAWWPPHGVCLGCRFSQLWCPQANVGPMLHPTPLAIEFLGTCHTPTLRSPQHPHWDNIRPPRLSILVNNLHGQTATDSHLVVSPPCNKREDLFPVFWRF